MKATVKNAIAELVAIGLSPAEAYDRIVLAAVAAPSQPVAASPVAAAAAPVTAKPSTYREALVAAAERGSVGAGKIVARLDSLKSCPRCGRKFGPKSRGLKSHNKPIRNAAGRMTGKSTTACK